MGILSDYQENNRLKGIEDVDIPEVVFPENTEQDTIKGAGQQQLTAPPNVPMPEIPRVDIPFQDIEFDTFVPAWQSAPELEATMPGGSSTNIALPFLQNVPSSQILNPINQRDENGAYRNPVLEGLADLFGVRKGYEEYYQRNYGQLGLAGPLFYLLTTPFNVATGVGADLGRIGAAYSSGMSRSTENFYKNLKAGQNLGQLSRNALKDYVQGYGDLLQNTDDGKDYTLSQRALLGNQFSFSDEKVNKEGKFSPYGLLPEYGTYKRAPDLKRRSTAARSTRNNEAVNNVAGLIGVPAQVVLDIFTGQGLKGKQSLVELPRASDWLADRVEQAEQDPANYYKGLLGLGLDAAFDGFITDVPGYVNKAVENAVRVRTRVEVVPPGALAPLDRNFQWNPSGGSPLNTGRPRADRTPLLRDPPIDVEGRTVNEPRLPPARERPAPQLQLPGQPMLPPTGDRVPFNPVSNPPRPPRLDLVPTVPELRINSELLNVESLREVLEEPDVSTYIDTNDSVRYTPPQEGLTLDENILRISQADLENMPIQGMSADSFIFDDPAVGNTLGDLFNQADEIGTEDLATQLGFGNSVPDNLDAPDAGEIQGFIRDRFRRPAAIRNYLSENDAGTPELQIDANRLGLESTEYVELLQAAGRDDGSFNSTFLSQRPIQLPEAPSFQRRLESITDEGMTLREYSEYGQNAYEVRIDANDVKFTDFVKWFKQSLNDPEFDGKSLILRADVAQRFTSDIPGRSNSRIIFDGANIRVGRILEKLGWDANWQFGYARFDNLNVRGIQDTVGGVLSPRLRKDRMRWKTDNYVKQISDFFGAPKDLWYGEKFNELYGQINDLRNSNVMYLEEGAVPQGVFDELYVSIVANQSRTATTRIIEGFLRDNYPVAFETLSRSRRQSIVDYINYNDRSADPGELSQLITREARESQIDANPGVQQLIADIATPDVLQFDLAQMAVIKQLPPDMRGTGVEYIYTLQELINSDTELENALVRMNDLNDAYAELSQDIEFRPPTGAESYNPQQQSAILPTREIGAQIQRGDVVSQNLNRAQSMARQPVPAPRADARYGEPSVIMYDTENVRMMDLESFGGLQQQIEALREQFDPETFDVVYNQILEGFANDFDILPDGTVINPQVFFETLRQPVRETGNAVQLRVESFNASPNPDSAGNLQAQLLDEIEQQLEAGYEALDNAFNRNEYAEDTLRDIVEQQREAIFSNDEDFPVRSTDESYNVEIDNIIEEDPTLRLYAEEVIVPSRSFQRIWDEYSESLFDAMRDSDPDAIIDAAVNFRESHTQMWDEATQLYENVTQAFIETSRQQGIWVPADIFPLLEDIC